MNKVRVRFAPSPTGALHIGGVRTALYNYLFAKKIGGIFILRIEDTDQTRYVEGAENYIVEALEWLGLKPDEGPNFGGEHGPYRQSERKAMYGKFAQQLVDQDKAYYAFDTPEELDAMREEMKAAGNHHTQYNHNLRRKMQNSLTLSETEVKAKLDAGASYVVRLKVLENETIEFEDIVRGKVSFQSNELDDKILLKADGMPTYHLANIVDDHHMEISHVIRGEEWLPSTPTHVLLYRGFGWEMPQFAHLPLILKPNGKGKLSKRDGTKLGIPVFPLDWNAVTAEESFRGFKSFGFLPNAVLNFLALLGWSSSDEQEIFSLEQLIEAFDLERINKGGARFDYDKAKWFNQQYIIATPTPDLLKLVRPLIEKHGHQPSDAYLTGVCELLKERVQYVSDFWEAGYYFFEDVREYDAKTVRKKWKPERLPLFEDLNSRLKALASFDAVSVKKVVEAFIEETGLKFGDILPILRLATSGTMKGPDMFGMLELMGKKMVTERLEKAFAAFA